MAKGRNTNIAYFCLNAVGLLLHCQTSISQWLNLFSLVTHNSTDTAV